MGGIFSELDLSTPPSLFGFLLRLDRCRVGRSSPVAERPPGWLIGHGVGPAARISAKYPRFCFWATAFSPVCREVSLRLRLLFANQRR